MVLVPILIVLGVVVIAGLILISAGRMLVNVGGQEVGLVERKYVGKPLPPGRVVALPGEVGIQARALQPGLKLLPPFRYSVAKSNMIVIGEDEVGLIEAIDGLPLDPGRIFARHVDGHDSFQDGEAFLRNGGQKGPQVDVLPPGKYRINTYLFHVRNEPAVLVPQRNGSHTTE